MTVKEETIEECRRKKERQKNDRERRNIEK